MYFYIKQEMPANQLKKTKKREKVMLALLGYV